MIDTANGQIDIRDLGYRQARFNLHSAEYGNIMYAYSGESGDYLYGTLRTLPFLYEYNRWLMQAYLGQNMNFATTSFNDLYTGKQREFLVSYATAANSAGAGAPKADLTAQMVFISDDGFVPDYGPLTATTVADVNALGTALNGKILVCMIAANNNDNAAIAIAAQSRGAVGVLFCTRLSSLQGYQHSHYTPNLGTGTAANNNPALITIPVAGTAKQYLRELYEKSLADPTTTMTLNTGLRRLESQKWQFERQLGAFMENMGMAAEYSSHVKGVIKDSAGNPLPQAALNLKMQVFSPQLTSGSGNWAHQITQSGVLEQTQTALYNVAGGAYDWFVTPSKQPTNPVGIGATQFPDLGYDITASANGKYSSTKNVKIAQYQATVSGVDFVLPDAITVDFDFAQVLNPKFTLEIPFSTYIMTAGGLDSAKGSPDGAVAASANGYDVEVVDLGGGDYKAVFSPYKECAVSGAGTAEFVIEIDGTNVLPHSVYTDMLIFSAAGDYAVYLTCGQTSLDSGDTLYVDVMLKGLFNYTQVTADIAYDADLLDFYGYENMGGFISACSPLGAGLAAVRSIPTTNMILGGSCLAGERIVTLKFMVKSSAAEQSAATALYVATALVNPPAGYLGTNAIAGPDLPASLTLHTQTYANLYASVQGETNANAAYTAFAAQALADGYPAIARLFTATADAELKHADDEWNILAGMGATVRPTADAPTVGTTLDNLLAAFNGETYEYTVMYPGFLATAQAEGITAAATIFRRAGAAEAVHAGNYADVRALLEAGDTAAIEADYAVLYRCVTCGEVVTARPTNCPICNVPGSTFVQYQ
jgi:rubrerythrin